MRYLLLLLFLTGCASSAPGTFKRGAYVSPPPAPAARPGVGAPSVGQPGRPHALPRSPHVRVLPETPETMREPGLWAGDEPKAIAGPKVAILLNLVIELPKKADEAKAIKQCVALMARSLYWSGQYSYVNALEEKKQQCVAAMFMATCASSARKKEVEQMVPPGTPMDKATDLAANLANKHCDGVELTPEDETMMKAVYNEWSKKTGGQWWE
jgi:hypothetical protein